MKFGKQIQADQVPGWYAFYLDYKALKKIISALVANRPASEAAALAVGDGHPPAPGALPTPPTSTSGHPLDEGEAVLSEAAHGALLEEPPILSAIGIGGGGGQNEERRPEFGAHKAAFFFKLERELEKINGFYLQKEAELKLRLETLLSKRRAAAMRVPPSANEDDSPHRHVEWTAVEEGFRLLERDLRKLQQFVEINAIGFRKILKKWDKRSKSVTKELYLARQVDVQPVFNRQLIAELSDTVATCLLDVTDLSNGLNYEKPGVNDLILSNQISADRAAHTSLFRDLESSLQHAIAREDRRAVQDAVRYSATLAAPAQPTAGGAGVNAAAATPGSAKANVSVTRILWQAILDAPPDLADLILACTTTPFDYHFVDDINGRTALHSAAMVGMLRLCNICLDRGVAPGVKDLYGRSALHYACMNGHADVCRRLLEVGVGVAELDMDNYSPLVYAILRGNAECVRLLLEEGNVPLASVGLNDESMPLSLAAQAGHASVVTLLLTHGAKSLPNTNGEYPIHLAAKEGHVDVCKLLVDRDGWDVKDKYNEWTPLFHAARFGHYACIETLLDAGARPDTEDELGNTASYYAAWFGHRSCVALLLRALSLLPSTTSTTSPPPTVSDASTERPGGDNGGNEVDFIPSLSLPPPIMPYRVYGHNYLDKSTLIQVSLGQLTSDSDVGSPAIELHPRLSGSQSRDRNLHASPFLKFVVTAFPSAASVPFTISLPVRGDEAYTFPFQATGGLDGLNLEMCVHPNFGTRTVGRAVVKASTLRDAHSDQRFVVPLLDHRLHVIGDVRFTVNVIRPFEDVKLAIGGAVETYWKSMALPVSAPTSKPMPSRALPGGPGSSATSPSIHSMAALGGHATVIASATGSYLHLVVQVTRDLNPVVYPEWRLPEEAYDLGVADVSLSQFEGLARRSGKALNTDDQPMGLAEWRELLARSMVSLQQLLQVLPVTVALSLELALPSQTNMDQNNLRSRLDKNQFVDSVLRTIYHTPVAASNVPGTKPVRRRITFLSFSPDICAALNWKQPNYPVFFGSHLGKPAYHPSFTAGCASYLEDRRTLTVGSAVEFAKSNNLLGVFLAAELLVQVPSLVQGVKDTGLLVGTFGSQAEMGVLCNPIGSGEATSVDATLQDGILTFMDHAMRGAV